MNKSPIVIKRAVGLVVLFQSLLPAQAERSITIMAEKFIFRFPSKLWLIEKITIHKKESWL